MLNSIVPQGAPDIVNLLESKIRWLCGTIVITKDK
jgi:hypothetical protein